MLKIQFKDGRKPAMWLIDSTLKIGSDPSCELVVDEPMVDGVHVELNINQNEILLRNVSGKRSVFVNDIPIIKEQVLHTWDVIRLGTCELEVVDPLKQRKSTPLQDAGKTVVRPSVSPWGVKAISTPLDGQYFSLTNGLVIGRDERSDIKLPFSYVSRKHLKVAIRKEKLFVEDLNSSNGTYVNGEQVKSCELRNGDELRLDEFIFHVVGPDTGNNAKPRAIVRSTKTNMRHEKSKPGNSATSAKKLVASHRVFLHGLSDDVEGKVFEITNAENHISRTLGHHLSTSEKSVSARHVYLREIDLGWEIKNDGAADGLLVNDKMQSRVILQDGDELIVGGSLLKFQCIGEQPLNYARPVKESGNKTLLIISVFIIAVALAATAYLTGIFNI